MSMNICRVRLQASSTTTLGSCEGNCPLQRTEVYPGEKDFARFGPLLPPLRSSKLRCQGLRSKDLRSMHIPRTRSVEEDYLNVM